eukprot:TRINITY_DN1084_c0_g1_i23.p1 TRINITY_DN1084_c0_g1~~TRINITY_DN1084_c0_g1_i23.p1  ORF type:complete len:324 (+),score=72.25 TRINITY_DN1084_c0_g1_i23:66-1037(+)
MCIRDSTKYVSISGNSYSKEFCRDFGEELKKCVNLERLNLNDIFVGRKKDEIPESLTNLTKYLASNEKLYAMDLSNNAIGPNGAQALAPFFETTKTLKVLIINNCGLGIEGARIIAQALQKGNVNLEVISMARNRIEDDGVTHLASSLRNMTELREVYVFQNFIRKEGMKNLLEALKSTTKLEALDVQDNYIIEGSVDALISIIYNSEKLKVINVSDCNISEDSNERIIEALEATNLKFEKFGYNYNELNDSDLAKRFLNVLVTENPNLKRLDIKGNDFSKNTKKYYQETLKAANKLQVLSRFESDDEEEEDDQTQLFSDLKV